MKRFLLLFVLGAIFLAGCAGPVHYDVAEAPSMVADFGSVQAVQTGVSNAPSREICINVYGGAYCGWAKTVMGFGLSCAQGKNGDILDTRWILIKDLKILLSGLPVEFGVEENPCDADKVYNLVYTVRMYNQRVGAFSIPKRGVYAVDLLSIKGGGGRYSAANDASPGEIGVTIGQGLGRADRILADELAGVAVYVRYFLLKDLGVKDDKNLLAWIRKHGFRWSSSGLLGAVGLGSEVKGVLGTKWNCPESVCPGDKFYREYCESKHHKKPASSPPKTAHDGGSN